MATSILYSNSPKAVVASVEVTANITALVRHKHPSSTLTELGINALHVINPMIL